MIEVEKKFQPTEEQLQKLLIGAELVKEKEMHDVYYDFPDYRLFRRGDRLRKRNSGFELKAYHSKTESGVQVADEYEEEHLIKEKINLGEDTRTLSEIVEKDMIAVCDFNTKRTEYKKGEFVIDVDRLSFGVDLIEVEILVDSEDKIQEAEDKILTLVREFNIEVKDLPLKTGLYLQKVKPEVYQEIFGK